MKRVTWLHPITLDVYTLQEITLDTVVCQIPQTKCVGAIIHAKKIGNECIIFNKILPFNLKILELDCGEMRSLTHDPFLHITLLSVSKITPSIIEALKNNKSIKTFQCYNLTNIISLADLPSSIDTILNYNHNYVGPFNNITSLECSHGTTLTLQDLNQFPNLQICKYGVDFLNETFYNNSTIQTIGFDTKNKFQLKLSSVRDLSLFITVSPDITVLNDSFVYLFNNCPLIDNLYVVLFSDIPIEETIIINTKVKVDVSSQDHEKHHFCVKINERIQ